MVALNLRSKLPLLLCLLLTSFICGSQIFLLINEEAEVQTRQQARAELKKILLVAYNLWNERGELDTNTLWRHLGSASPRRDPWGSPYEIMATKSELRLRSAGPDRISGSADDMEQWLPRVISAPETSPVHDSGGKSNSVGAQ